MDLLQAMKERHSVRSYTDKKIEGQVKDDLQKFIEKCNNESGLHMQLVLNEPNAFNGFMAHYGNFKNVKNYMKRADITAKKLFYMRKRSD